MMTVGERARLLGLAGHPWASVTADPEVTARLRDALHGETAPEVSDLDARTAVPSLRDMVEDAIARHRRLGLPDDVTTHTLVDVGRKVQWYDGDIDTSWLLGLLRADVVGVGRLQAERVPGTRGRALHVPEGDRLDPCAVTASLVALRRLLGPSPLVCTSWLLDPHVLELSPRSNLVHFRARFAVGDEGLPTVGGVTNGDRAVARFVFRRSVADVLNPDAVHPHTSLERVVAATLRGGAHWTEPTGTLTTAGY